MAKDSRTRSLGAKGATKPASYQAPQMRRVLRSGATWLYKPKPTHAMGLPTLECPKICPVCPHSWEGLLHLRLGQEPRPQGLPSSQSCKAMDQSCVHSMRQLNEHKLSPEGWGPS